MSDLILLRSVFLVNYLPKINLNSKMILRALEVLSEFIISRCDLNNICYIDDTVLIADLEAKTIIQGSC